MIRLIQWLVGLFGPKEPDPKRAPKSGPKEPDPKREA